MGLRGMRNSFAVGHPDTHLRNYDNQSFSTLPRSGIKYAGGVLWALTGGCYRGAGAPLGLSVTHSSTVPRRGSLRPLCGKRRAKRCPPGNRGWRGSYRAPAVGDAPRHQPRVNARSTRGARTAIPLRGMVAKVLESSVVWLRSTAFQQDGSKRVLLF